VKDTFSRNGIPTDEQNKAYLAMLAATASVSADLKPESIFDFSLAAAAVKDLAPKTAGSSGQICAHFKNCLGQW
jgi:hypothetical protein